MRPGVPPNSGMHRTALRAAADACSLGGRSHGAHAKRSVASRRGAPCLTSNTLFANTKMDQSLQREPGSTIYADLG